MSDNLVKHILVPLIMCASVLIIYTHQTSCSELQPTVIYDSDMVTGSGPDTSENVAYGVTEGVLTTHNPTYDVVLR